MIGVSCFCLASLVRLTPSGAAARSQRLRAAPLPHTGRQLRRFVRRHARRVATVDDITRFASAHHFEALLGLVPGERSSGEKRGIGRITKAGNSRVRYLLVEAGWRILRSQGEETAALRLWVLGIAQRRGERIAVVALARRLAGILYAMWRDGEVYQARRVRTPRARLVETG